MRDMYKLKKQIFFLDANINLQNYTLPVPYENSILYAYGEF